MDFDDIGLAAYQEKVMQWAEKCRNSSEGICELAGRYRKRDDYWLLPLRRGSYNFSFRLHWEERNLGVFSLAVVASLYIKQHWYCSIQGTDCTDFTSICQMTTLTLSIRSIFLHFTTNTTIMEMISLMQRSAADPIHVPHKNSNTYLYSIVVITVNCAQYEPTILICRMFLPTSAYLIVFMEPGFVYTLQVLRLLYSRVRTVLLGVWDPLSTIKIISVISPHTDTHTRSIGCAWDNWRFPYTVCAASTYIRSTPYSVQTCSGSGSNNSGSGHKSYVYSFLYLLLK